MPSLRTDDYRVIYTRYIGIKFRLLLRLMIMLFVIIIPNKHNHAVIRIDYEDSLSFVFLSLLDGPRPSALGLNQKETCLSNDRPSKPLAVG